MNTALTAVRPPEGPHLRETIPPPPDDDRAQGPRDYSLVIVTLVRLYERAARRGNRVAARQFNDALTLLAGEQSAACIAVDRVSDDRGDRLRRVAALLLELIERTTACVSEAALTGRIPSTWLGRCRMLADQIFGALEEWNIQ